MPLPMGVTAAEPSGCWLARAFADDLSFQLNSNAVNRFPKAFERQVPEAAVPCLRPDILARPMLAALVLTFKILLWLPVK